VNVSIVTFAHETSRLNDKRDFARLLASGLAKSQADLCSFARRAMTGKAKVRQGDGKAVGKAKRNKKGWR